MEKKLSLFDFLLDTTEESSGLPRIPTIDELKILRKSLRKKIAPAIFLLPDEFGYEGVGHFQRKLIQDTLIIEWTTGESGSPKARPYQELCMSKDGENDRLEFGWMIANFARLDAVSYLSRMRPISYEDYHQDLFNKQYADQKKHFEKIETEWRHWSIVPAGHMKFK
jgi:hypothetical protein